MPYDFTEGIMYFQKSTEHYFFVLVFSQFWDIFHWWQAWITNIKGKHMQWKVSLIYLFICLLFIWLSSSNISIFSNRRHLQQKLKLQKQLLWKSKRSENIIQFVIKFFTEFKHLRGQQVAKISGISRIFPEAFSRQTKEQHCPRNMSSIWLILQNPLLLLAHTSMQVCGKILQWNLAPQQIAWDDLERYNDRQDFWARHSVARLRGPRALTTFPQRSTEIFDTASYVWKPMLDQE